jgi:uncharacterized protein YoxC
LDTNNKKYGKFREDYAKIPEHVMGDKSAMFDLKIVKDFEDKIKPVHSQLTLLESEIKADAETARTTKSAYLTTEIQVFNAKRDDTVNLFREMSDLVKKIQESHKKVADKSSAC